MCIPTAMVRSKVDVHDNDPASSSEFARSVLESRLAFAGDIAVKDTTLADECWYRVSICVSGLEVLEVLDEEDGRIGIVKDRRMTGVAGLEDIAYSAIVL
jgi:hypothetical protein